MKPFLRFLVVSGCVGVVIIAPCIAADTPPIIDPVGPVLKVLNRTAEAITLTAQGGEAPEPTAGCAPYTEISRKYEWQRNGITVTGEEGASLDVSRRYSSGKYEIQVRLSEVSWQDSSPTPLTFTTKNSSFSTTVIVIVYQLSLKEVGFGGDGNIRMREGFDYTDDDGDVINAPEWKVDQTPQPVCYIRATTPKVDYVMSVSPDIGEEETTVRIGLWTRQVRMGNEAEAVKVSSVRGSSLQEKGVSTKLTLDQAIDNHNIKITWSCSNEGDSEYDPIGDTTNLLYVPYDTPTGDSTISRAHNVTDLRVRYVTYHSRDLTAVDDIESAIFGTIACNPSKPLPDPQLWSMARGVAAECIAGARFMRLACGMCGLTRGKAMVIYPDPGLSVRVLPWDLSTQRERKTFYGDAFGHTESGNVPSGKHGKREYYWYWTRGDHQPNRFEGTYITPSNKYYCPGAGRFDDPESVMKFLADYSGWGWKEGKDIILCVKPGTVDYWPKP
jgi:hypothetical protein